MKNYILLLSILLTFTGCKLIAKEMKRSNEIRKITKQACGCKYVGVSTNYDNGNKTLTLTIRKTSSDDYALIADSIMGHLQTNYEKVCNYGEIFILFETDDLTERYTYYGCDDEPEHDSFDPNEWEDWDDEEFEEGVDTVVVEEPII